MQHPDVAGVADEVEALTIEVDPLLHRRDQATKRFSMLAGGVADARDRVGERLRAELAWHAERNRKVEMTHPQTIDSRQRGDGVGVVDTLGGLDLAEERAAAVRGDELVDDRARPIAIVRNLQGDAAASVGRVFHRLDDVAGFIHVANHRQHQPLGAHVHRAGDVMVFLRRGSHDHRQIGRLEIADRALHRLEAESGMLEIEQHEVATRRLENVADPGRRELHDEMPELWSLCSSQLLQPLRRHPFLPHVRDLRTLARSSASTRATA